MNKFKFTFFLALVPLLLGAQRIINGTVVSREDDIYWSVVRVIERGPGGYWLPNCTGLVLTDTLVLTAAHCVDKKSISNLRIGYEIQPFSFEQQADEATRIDPTVEFETQEIDGWYIHPDYQKNKVSNDLVVIQIKGHHPFKYHPLPLITPEVMKKFTPEKKYPFIIAGYGLLAASPTVESEELRRARVEGKYTGDLIEMIQSDGYGGCFGDSGGPAIVYVGSNFYLAGITHGSKTRNPTCDETGVWVNLANHLVFIQSVIKKN